MKRPKKVRLHYCCGYDKLTKEQKQRFGELTEELIEFMNSKIAELKTKAHEVHH